MRLLFWQDHATHYQTDLYRALQSNGCQVMVCYYGEVGASRLAMCWDNGKSLSDFEITVAPFIESVDRVPDWKTYIHVITGNMGTSFSRHLPIYLSKHNVQWVHWNESPLPNLRAKLVWPLRKKYAKLINGHALGAFGIGKRAMQCIADWGVTPERIAFLPYSPSAGDLSASEDLQCVSFLDGDSPFLYLGVLSHRKATDVIINAFAQVTRIVGHAKWKLIFVGNDTSCGQYQKLAERLGLQGNILFRGPVPPTGLSGIIKQASVVLLPSRYDGWGVTLNEGASMGKALIGSDKTGAADYLIDQGWNGFRVKAGSIDSLCSALKAYISCPGLAERHGAHSREIWQQFSPTQNAQRLIQTIGGWMALGR